MENGHYFNTYTVHVMLKVHQPFNKKDLKKVAMTWKSQHDGFFYLLLQKILRNNFKNLYSDGKMNVLHLSFTLLLKLRKYYQMEL